MEKEHKKKKIQSHWHLLLGDVPETMSSSASLTFNKIAQFPGKGCYRI